MRRNDRFAEIMRNRRNIFVTTAWGDTLLVSHCLAWFTLFSGQWNGSGFESTSQIALHYGARPLYNGRGWHIGELRALLFLSYHIAHHRSSFDFISLRNYKTGVIGKYENYISPFVRHYPDDIFRLADYFRKLSTVDVRNVGGQKTDLFGGPHV